MGEMPFELAKAAIDKYAGGLREVIPSTMGEPLLYSKFAELLDYCSARKIPLNLTTNGTFPGIWGTDAGMERLLLACSDIKVSCMGFSAPTFDEMMPGVPFDCWRGNVERLLGVKRRLREGVSTGRNVATVSLQVTLHSRMLESIPDIALWADSVGIERIKWNMPVFIEPGEHLRGVYGISHAKAQEARSLLNSLQANGLHVRFAGSLFLESPVHGNVGDGPCGLFLDEVWVLSDGSEERCPNPERRFGNRVGARASCSGCALLHPLD